MTPEHVVDDANHTRFREASVSVTSETQNDWTSSEAGAGAYLLRALASRRTEQHLGWCGPWMAQCRVSRRAGALRARDEVVITRIAARCQ